MIHNAVRPSAEGATQAKHSTKSYVTQRRHLLLPVSVSSSKVQPRQ
jgi:hypothetical protein